MIIQNIDIGTGVLPRNICTCNDIGTKRVPCLKTENVVYLQDLVVSETLRSGGIGAKLIEACKEYGRQNGADFMRTQIFPQNVRGMQFYERQGFSEKMKTIETYL